jgi:serine/threonine protein kinase/WD40 repeat protein
MSLNSGAKLGPYEILSKIGAGGMGEVYRARDTRLERTVAIKILPSEFSRHAELRKRLEREARTLSSLAHPHICSLYDVGQQDGVDFLVMEYLEGETMAHRLLKGALRAGQVLQHGIEIADALDRAHRHGIVHRDLKPGNIMLTKDGAKLLDFGLARVEAPAAPLIETLTRLETQNEKLTEKGMVLGTFQYMAPEQLEGKEADARTDIFALGAVIYEMATGKAAFFGNNRTSLITAILASEPPAMTSLQPLTPPALERVVKTCMAKDPDSRWQSAQDLKLQLEWIAEGGSQAGVPAPVAARRRSREKIAWTLVALLTVAAVALGIGFLKRTPKSPPRVSFAINPPPGLIFPDMMAFAVSPDGRQVAFVPSDGQIWMQRLDEFAPRKLPGTDGAEWVFWSPDSRFIAFSSDNKLKSFDPARDRLEILCDTAKHYWTLNQHGVALAGGVNPITSLKIENCKQENITQFDSARGEFAHAFPTFLPGGRIFLYVIFSPGKEDQTTVRALYMGSLGSAEKHLLLQKASNAEYVSPGYVVFAPEGDLTAQVLDMNRMQLTGQAFPLRESRIAHSESNANASFSVSENGVLVYQPEVPSVNQLRWMDRSGKKTGEVIPPGQFQRLRLSSDGKNILLARIEPGTHRGDFWKFDINRKIWIRLTGHSSPGGGWALFSPDQRRIAFAYNKSGMLHLYLKDAESSPTEELLLDSANWIYPLDWSSDGRLVLYAADGGLRVVSLAERKSEQIATEVDWEQQARFAPNGHAVVYVSERSGRAEVYLQRFPGHGPPRLVSGGGGVFPVWSHDGKEIFFLSPDRKLMSARVGSDLQTETARPLFELDARPDDIEYEVAPDGHFLILMPTEQSAAPLRVVMNWTADLKH